MNKKNLSHEELVSKMLENPKSKGLDSAGDPLTQLKEMLPEEAAPSAMAILERWLNAPMSALSGKAPTELMGTDEGRVRILALLKQVEAGVFI